MPFDGRQPCLEIQIIDKALEVLGRNGEFWIQHRNSDYRGGRCIMGAVMYARRKLNIKGDRTEALLLKTTYGAPRGRIKTYLLIEAWNDDDRRKFDQIAAALVQARNLAATR
jgi:hypothetical protein